MDLFISYRRNGGESWAALIKGELEKRKVSAYLDKHNMKNGHFDEALRKNIANSPNFLLILSPNIFDKRPEGETDWVREEIIYAVKQKKNLILLMVNGFDPKVDLSSEVDEIKNLMTYDMLVYNDLNINMKNASIDSIIQRMVDEEGKKWKKTVKSNSWYASHEVTEEDRLWMWTNYEACKKMDYHLLVKMVDEDIFKNNQKLSLFILDLYDAKQINKRVHPENRRIDGIDNINKELPEIDVYGFCHEHDMEEVDEFFGLDHFLPDIKEQNLESNIKLLLRKHNLRYFDIVDCTLILKDLKNPEHFLRMIVNYLNPNGGIIFVRDLDDDYVSAYPDDEKYIETLVQFLSLDVGAGNRHLGKKIYSYLLRAGADKVVMTNEVASTARLSQKGRRILCDAYFSYLRPEFETLYNEYPENEEYEAALNWLNDKYDDVLTLFARKDFYFRAGFIAGYGVFYQNLDFDDEDF